MFVKHCLEKIIGVYYAVAQISIMNKGMRWTKKVMQFAEYMLV